MLLSELAPEREGSRVSGRGVSLAKSASAGSWGKRTKVEAFFAERGTVKPALLVAIKQSDGSFFSPSPPHPSYVPSVKPEKSAKVERRAYVA